MLVATFGPNTAWVGKTITREGDAFILEGYGPISAADVMAYGSQGQLLWATDGTRAWVGSKARAQTASPPSSPPAEPAATSPAAADGTAARGPEVVTNAATHRPTFSRRVLIVAGAALALIVVVGILVVANPFGNDTWPSHFEGTWVPGAEARTDGWRGIVISRGSGGTVSITGTSDKGKVVYTFEGDNLTYEILPNEPDPQDYTAHGSPWKLRRRPDSTGEFVGQYAGFSGLGYIKVQYDGKVLSLNAALRPDAGAGTNNLTLAEDGKSLILDSGLGGNFFAFARQ